MNTRAPRRGSRLSCLVKMVTSSGDVIISSAVDAEGRGIQCAKQGWISVDAAQN